MRRLPVFLTLFLILTACAAPSQPTEVPVDTSEPQSNAPLLDGTFERSLLVSAWRGSSEGNVLFLLDPATGNPLPGYPEIPLGHTFFYALSPDRKTLAVASFPNASTYNGNLFLINLPAWKTRDLGLELSGWVSIMVFSPDGKELAITHGETSYKLTMVNLEDRTITAQSPTYSYISCLKFSQNGQALMLYRSTTNPVDGFTGGPPQVLLLDAADLTPRWSADLEDVLDGIFPRGRDVTPANYYEPGKAFYISPGLVFAPDRDALYVVHADSDQLTVVDFESQHIQTDEIQTKLSWFERLLSMTASIAHAKVGDGITRQATISPDGQFLYVAGGNSMTSQDQHGNWQMEQTPLGLEIIQTRDGSRVEHIDTDTTEVSISPDGRFLYVRNWGNNQDNIPWTEIIDTSTGQSIARKPGISGTPALLMNGDYLLVSTYSTSEYLHHMSVLEPDGSQVLAKWSAPRYIWWLTTP